MKTAFIVLKSPQEQDPSRAIEALAVKEDATVILVEDGVLQALSKHALERLAKVSSEILISKEDIEACIQHAIHVLNVEDLHVSTSS